MTAIDKSSIVASKNAVSCDLAGESVILDMKSGKYFALDDVGTRIWQLLQSPSTLQSICDQLTQEYDVSMEGSVSDVSTLLRRLVDQGLATYAEAV
jgi:hypothetical protein